MTSGHRYLLQSRAKAVCEVSPDIFAIFVRNRIRNAILEWVFMWRRVRIVEE
jgi:hypothetical protein